MTKIQTIKLCEDIWTYIFLCYYDASVYLGFSKKDSLTICSQVFIGSMEMLDGT